MTNALYYPNGINGSRGTYAVEPQTEAELAETIRRQPVLEMAGQQATPAFTYLNTKKEQVELRDLPGQIDELQARLEAAPPAEQEELAKGLKKLKKRLEKLTGQKHLVAVPWVDPTQLSQSGWGIIFAREDTQARAKQEALAELIKWRKSEAQKDKENLFQMFDGPRGYQAGESHIDFLSRHKGATNGPVDPEKGIPYYLLLVGGPELIPYEFQYQLDVQYAVGRLDFGNDLVAYAQYAAAVVAAEKGEVRLPRRASFFGVANPDDPATNLSAEYLIKPLYQTSSQRMAGWQFELTSPAEALKSRLAELLAGGDQTPALLFTATHGMEFEPEDTTYHPRHQGALLCQDWPGPRGWQGRIKEDFYFSADDLASQANLVGRMAFHFACYSAGTPQTDEFEGLKRRNRPLAARPFTTTLPQKLLRQGALAVIGHVERAWDRSFYDPVAGSQTVVFEAALSRLLKGEPVGLALEYFNERYAEIATTLNKELTELQNVELVRTLDAQDVAALPSMWIATHDARNYIILGDPAVRLPLVNDDQPEVKQPSISTSFALPATPAEAVASSAPSAEGKPLAAISDEDWNRTPLAVQNLLREAVARLKQIKGLSEWEVGEE